MRIGIDVRYLSHGLTGGVHTYVRSLVPELIKQAVDDEIVLYADTKAPLELQDLPAHVRVRYLPYKGQISSVYNDVRFGALASQDHLDVMHFPANYGFGPAGAATIITLHDELTAMPLSETLFRAIGRGHIHSLRMGVMVAYIHWATMTTIKRAAAILTVSEHARRRIGETTGVDTSRIVAVHSAQSELMRRTEDVAALQDVRARHGITRPFVLADGLKNPAVLIRAWALLPEELRRSHEIVFFSRRPEVLPVVPQAVADGHARLLVGASQADLIGLYSLAEAFVFPSWIEGFGIPLLEAMACGAPVIASDRGSIPEVAGGAALLMDAEDAQGLARHLQTVLLDQGQQRELRARGFRRAAEFSWEKTATRTIDTYRMAARRAASSISPIVHRTRIQDA